MSLLHFKFSLRFQVILLIFLFRFLNLCIILGQDFEDILI